jgi:hypothetical protein
MNNFWRRQNKPLTIFWGGIMVEDVQAYSWTEDFYRSLSFSLHNQDTKTI